MYTDTDTKPGGSSPKSQAQANFRNALSGPGSEMSKSKSNPKGTTESTISTPNQVEITYNQFVSLGMPTDVISLTEFGSPTSFGMRQTGNPSNKKKDIHSICI